MQCLDKIPSVTLLSHANALNFKPSFAASNSALQQANDAVMKRGRFLNEPSDEIRSRYVALS